MKLTKGDIRGSRVDQKKKFWMIVLGALLFDQITKKIVRGQIPLHHSLDFGWIALTHTTNTGISFGMLREYPIVPTVAAVIISVWIIWSIHNEKHNKLISTALALILSGAVGNLVDRIIQGFVTDFIDLKWWPVFNVADSAITVGGVMLVVALIIEEYQLHKKITKRKK